LCVWSYPIQRLNYKRLFFASRFSRHS
jgi:hypothetical protein